MGGCTASDPLTDDIYLSSLYVDGVTIDGEFIPPAIYARWSTVTLNNNPEVMGYDGVTGSYFTIPLSSVLAFKLIVVARDNTADEIAVWKIENGSIKRAGNNTAMLITASTDIVTRDDAMWSISVTGVPAEDALSITVVGDAVNKVRWSAVMYGVLVQF